MIVATILIGSVAAGILLGVGGLYWKLIHSGDNLNPFVGVPPAEGTIRFGQEAGESC